MKSFDEILNERKKQKKDNGLKSAYADGRETFESIMAQRELSKIASDMKDYSSKVNGVASQYKDGYREDNADWLKKLQETNSETDKMANDIKYGLAKNRRYYSDDLINNFKELLNSGSNSMKGLISSAETMSQFKSQDDYDKAKIGWLSDDAETDADTVKARKEYRKQNDSKIADLDNQIEAKQKEIAGMGGAWFWESDKKKELEQKKAELKKLNDQKSSLVSENRKYDSTQGKTTDKYYDITQKADFDTVSANRNISNPSREELNEYDTKSDSTLYHTDAYGNTYDAYGNKVDEDYLKNNKQPVINDRLGLYFNTSDKEKNEAYAYTGNDNTWASAIKDGVDGSWDELSKDEIDVYYYILNATGKESADKYLKDMTPTLNKRSAQKSAEAIDNADALGKIALNIASVPASVYGGATAFVEDVANTIKGEDINPYSTAHGMLNFSSDVRGSTAQDINEATGNKEFLGISTGDVYQALMSSADSLMGAKFVGRPYTVIMGMSAASTEAKRLKESGASDEQIATGGLLAGIAESLFEYVSLDHFLKLKTPESIAQAVKSTLAQGGVEASEEVFTEICNTLTNAMVMGNSSDLSQSVAKYMDEGKSYSEASALALLDVGKNVWQSGVGGFISGGLMGGVDQALGYADYANYRNQEGRYVNQNGDISELINLARETAGATTDTDISKDLNRYSDKVAKKPSNKNVGNLSLKTQTAVENQNLADLEKSLKRKGLSDSQISEVKDVASKMMNGVELTAKDQAVIESDSRVSKAIDDVVINPSSTASDRTAYYNNVRSNPSKIRDNIKKGVINQLNTIKKSLDSEQNENIKTELQKQYDDIKTVASSMGIQDRDTVQVDGKVSKSLKTVQISTGKEVSIKNISDIKDGKITFELDNGEKVSNADISYANENEALVYESMAKMDYDVSTANAVVQAYNASSNVSASEFVAGMEDGYRYGWTNTSKNMRVSENFNKLSNAQKELALSLGVDARKVDTASRKANVTANVNESEKGKVIYDIDRKIDTKHMKNVQRVGLRQAEVLAEMTGTPIHVYESVLNTNSKRVFAKDIAGHKKGTKAPNGFYDTKTGTIYVDINAGNHGEGTILYTLAHEYTHQIRQGSPEKFDALANFLVSEYGKNNISLETLINKKMHDARLNKKDLSYDEAYEEVVADSMQTMLTDANVAEKLAKLKKTDKGLWDKLKELINKLFKGIQKVYSKYNPDSMEAQYVKRMGDSLQRLSDLFAKGLADASDNINSASDINVLSKVKGAKSTNGDTLFQYRAMEEDESKYRQMLVEHKILNNSEIDKLFETVDLALEKVKSNLEALDYAWEADIDDRAFNAVKPNSDHLYQVSVDFSTLCRKRILQQVVQAQLQEALNRQLSREESIVIRDELMKIQEEGKQIEVACALCYVESAKMKSPAQIKKFISNRENIIKDFFAGTSKGEIKQKIKAAEIAKRQELAKRFKNKGIETMSLKEIKSQYGGNTAQEIRDAKKSAKQSYAPTAEEQKLLDVANSMTVSDFTSPEGLEKLAKQYPRLFDAYTSYVRNATKSKGIENDTWWRAGDSKSIGDTLIENMNRENGLRTQSWSDFQVIHLLDYIAATIELSTRNAKMQSYTKVPDYVSLMGNTNQMINMSLIPTRDFDGTLRFDDVEGFVYKKALELRDKYHATAGTICIGVNNDQISLLLKDDKIDYVIPYHKSGMAQAIRNLMHIPKWSEYEKYQNETNISSKEDALANAKKHGVELTTDSDLYQKTPNFSDWFNLKEAQQIAKMENSNPSNKAEQKKYGVMYGAYKAMQNAAENYKKICAERGLNPKFTQFLDESNYWKLLIDRKMVDNVTGEIIEQKAIKPIFDQNEVLRILDDEIARYPSVKADQDYATRKVIGKFVSGELDSKIDKETQKAIQANVDNLAKMNILASTESNSVKASDTTYDLSGQLNSERVTDKDTLDFLNKQIEDGNYVTVYRSFQVIDGGLYAPMNAVDRDENGKNKRLGYRSEIGKWEMATESPEIAQRYMDNHPDAPYAKFDLDGVDNKTGGVAYNPYLHSSNLVLNDQFSAAYRRNLVTVECRVPMSEIGAYKAKYAKDSTGWVEWKPGGVAGKLMKVKPELTRKLFVSRYMLPTRILSDTEVAKMYKRYLDGTDISVPWNVVTPSLRHELEKNGVNISYNDIKSGGKAVKFEDKFPSDIRYSERSEELLKQQNKVLDAINKENLKLKEDNQNLKELVKIQSKLTHGKALNPKSIEAVARKLMSYSNAKGNTKDFANVLGNFYEYIVKGENLNWDTMREEAQPAINWLINNQYHKAELSDDAKDIFGYLKGKRVYIDEMQKKEIASQYGNYDNFRRQLMGRVTLTSDKSAIALDSLWSEMAELYPAYFDYDTNALDMPSILYDTIDSLKDSDSYADMEYEYYGDMLEQDLFSKLYDGYWDVSTLHTVADKYQKQISLLKANHKYQMDKVRKFHNDRNDKLKADYQQKIKDLKAKNKQRNEEQKQKIIDKYHDQKKRAYERKEMTNMRHKIKKIVDDFNTRLKNPKEGKYIPRDMVQTVSEVLNIINLDSGRSKKLSEKLLELKDVYQSYMDDSKYNAPKDEFITAMIDTLRKNIGDTSISKMSYNQLNQLETVLTSIHHIVTNAVKVKGIETEMDAYEISQELRKETADAKGTKNTLTGKWLQSQLRPGAMFERLGGFKKNSMWSKVANMLNKGQLKSTQIQMESGMMFAELLNDAKNLRTLSDTKNLVDVGLVDEDGNPVLITRGMMLALRKHLMNEDNVKHIYMGGLTVPNISKYYSGGDAYGRGSVTVHGISPKISDVNDRLADANRRFEKAVLSNNLSDQAVIGEEIDRLKDEKNAIYEEGKFYATGLASKIDSMLTNYEKKWLAISKNYFDGYSRNKLNETTMDVYGFEKAHVDDYMPIHTDKNFRTAAFDSIKMDMSLENSGFMKDRVNASNPIMLEDLTEVIDSQINKVARYCGVMPVIRDFTKIYGKSEEGFANSLQDTIAKKFGSDGNKYIEHLMADLTGSRVSDDGLINKVLNKGRGAMAQGVLSLNPRVALAQAASYPTAASEIGWSPLIKALAHGGKNDSILSSADKELIMKYSPLLWYRMQGFSTIEMGDAKNANKFENQVMSKMKWMMGWINAIDGATVGRLWYASQYYVDDNFGNLEKGSDEYYEKVAEVFNNVVEKTQPNYTTMQRPDILRNPNAVMRQLTMFMTQRLQNFNILFDSASRYSKYRSDLINHKNNVTKEDLANAKHKLINSVASQVVAGATIVIMKGLVDALLHNVNAYRDDDDDELTGKSISLQLINNFCDTMVGSMLWGSDLYKVINSITTKSYYSGVSLSGVDALGNALEDFVKVGQEFSLKNCNELSKSICNALGIPLENAEKIGTGIYNHIIDAKNGEFLSFESGVERKSSQKQDIMYKAFVDGDYNKLNKYKEELITDAINSKVESGKSEKEAMSSVRSSFSSIWKKKFLKAYAENNIEEMESIRRFLSSLGIFDDVVETTQTWIKNSKK